MTISNSPTGVDLKSNYLRGFEGCGWNRTQVDEQINYFISGQRDLWPTDLKTIGFFLRILLSLKAVGELELKCKPVMSYSDRHVTDRQTDPGITVPQADCSIIRMKVSLAKSLCGEYKDF